jgi:hypothetical protein
MGWWTDPSKTARTTEPNKTGKTENPQCSRMETATGIIARTYPTKCTTITIWVRTTVTIKATRIIPTIRTTTIITCLPIRIFPRHSTRIYYAIIVTASKCHRSWASNSKWWMIKIRTVAMGIIIMVEIAIIIPMLGIAIVMVVGSPMQAISYSKPLSITWPNSASQVIIAMAIVIWTGIAIIQTGIRTIMGAMGV